MYASWKKLSLISACIASVCGAAVLRSVAADAPDGPAAYRYDPSWPKPLPSTWALGGITGIFVDQNDHIWVLNRPGDLDDTNNYLTLNPPAAECCTAAPAVLEFDTAGTLLRSWGNPGFVAGWPKSEHTIFTDRAGNVYIAGAQPGDTIMKFTADGKFISEFGRRGQAVPIQGQKQDNQQTDLLLRGVAAATLDEDAHELYVADGYLNKRVLVFDSDTGSFKRGWGAYGKPLSETNLKGPTRAWRIWVDDVNSDGKLDILVGDSVTLVEPAKGLTDKEFKTKSAEWQKEWDSQRLPSNGE